MKHKESDIIALLCVSPENTKIPMEKTLQSCCVYSLSVWRFGLLENGPERKWDENVSVAVIELGLELNPVETQGVQKGWQAFHETQDTDSQGGPKCKDGPQDDTTVPSAHTEADSHDHVPEDFWELCVSQGQGPQSKVRGRVRYRPKGILNCVNTL